MSDKKQNTKDLIEELSGELTEVKVMRRPIDVALFWSALAITYIVVTITVLGVRGDIDNKIQDPVYIFELLHVIAISISAAICSACLRIPDIRGQKWMLAIPTSLFAAFVTWVALRLGLESYDMSGFGWGHCHSDSIAFGAIPAFMILFFSMRGKTTHPNMMSLMNILSVGAIGYLGLRITCASDDIGHLLGFHILPYLLFGIVISMVGKRIFRW